MISITPWIQRTFQFNFPIGLFPVIYSRLEGTVLRVEKLTENADEKTCSTSLNGWSIKQHIGHLTDLEELWWQRLMDFEQNRPVLTAADMSNKKTEMADHNIKPLQNILTDFSNERKRVLEIIYSFGEETLGKTGLHPRLNTPCAWWIRCISLLNMMIII